MDAHDEPCLDADLPSGWDEERFGTFVSEHRWKFASTMPNNPHEYTLRRDAKRTDFDSAVRYVREHGEVETFEGARYKTLYFGERKYWTMGAAVSETILINRKIVAT